MAGKHEMWHPVIFLVGSYIVIYVVVDNGSKYVDIYVGGISVDRYHIGCHVEKYVD